MRTFSEVLGGGDRRSIGAAEAVAATVQLHPSRFAELWKCLYAADPLVRMRAADALEKVSRSHALLFQPYKGKLLTQQADDGTAEVRWHLITIASRLQLNDREAARFCDYLEACVAQDSSRIVRVNALQAVTELAREHPSLHGRSENLLRQAGTSAWLRSERGRAGSCG